MLIDILYFSVFVKMILSVFIWTAVTITLVRGEIFEPLKKWTIYITPKVLEEYIATLLYCAQCSGFWVGIVGAVIILPEWIVPLGGIPVAVILHGFCISFTSTILDRQLYGNNRDS